MEWRCSCGAALCRGCGYCTRCERCHCKSYREGVKTWETTGTATTVRGVFALDADTAPHAMAATAKEQQTQYPNPNQRKIFRKTTLVGLRTDGELVNV